MNHEESIRVHAAEKYVLGELTREQRDQFEEHFFTCRRCAEEVRLATIFQANARKLFEDEERGSGPQHERRRLNGGSRRRR